MAEFLPFVRRWFDATFPEATRPQREGWDAIASGRPPGLSLIAASTLATHLRLVLDIAEGPRGGTRVRLLVPRQGA